MVSHCRMVYVVLKNWDLLTTCISLLIASCDRKESDKTGYGMWCVFLQSMKSHDQWEIEVTLYICMYVYMKGDYMYTWTFAYENFPKHLFCMTLVLKSKLNTHFLVLSLQGNVSFHKKGLVYLNTLYKNAAVSQHRPRNVQCSIQHVHAKIWILRQ